MLSLPAATEDSHKNVVNTCYIACLMIHLLCCDLFRAIHYTDVSLHYLP